MILYVLDSVSPSLLALGMLTASSEMMYILYLQNQVRGLALLAQGFMGHVSISTTPSMK